MRAIESSSRGRGLRRAAIVALCLMIPLDGLPGKTPDSRPQSQGKPPWLLSVAVKLHMKAVEGDKQAARDSRRMLEDLAAAEPANREVRAYLGSSYLLAAGMAVTPWVKWTYARKGLSLLDGAVAQDPDDPRMRFLRGISTMNLPHWFGRASQSASDISAVASGAPAYYRAGRLPADMAVCSLYFEGKARIRAGDTEGAEQRWKEAVRLDADDYYARQAAKALTDLEKGAHERREPETGTGPSEMSGRSRP